MFLGDALREREPEPGSLDPAGERIMGAIERLKDFRLLARRHPGAAVENADIDRIRRQITLDFDLFLVGTVFLRVRQEVHDNLRERVLVAAHRIRRRRGLPAGGESLLAQMQLVAFPGSRQDFVQIERPKIVALLFSFEPREIEDVVDQAG